MNEAKILKINGNQQYHDSQYFIHILDDNNIKEKYNQVELEISFQKLKDNEIKGCQTCKKQLVDFLQNNSYSISSLQFNVQDFKSLLYFLEDQQIVDCLKAIAAQEYILKLRKMNLSFYNQILREFINIFSQIKSLTIEINFSNYQGNPIEIFSCLNEIKELKSFSLQVKQIDWSENQLEQVFVNDIQCLPDNLEKLSFQLCKLAIAKNTFEKFLNILNNKISNSLKQFNLTLDYVEGDTRFQQEFLQNAVNLESFKLQITFRAFLDDIANILQNVSRFPTVKDFTLHLIECDLPVKLALDISQSLQNLSSLQNLNLTFVPQKMTMKTQTLKPLLLQFEESMKNLIGQNKDLQTLIINSNNYQIKTLLDAFGFFDPVQFTNFFKNQSYQNLHEITYIDCNYSGVNRYQNSSLDEFNQYQLPKNSQLIQFLNNNPQIIKLSIKELFVDNKFLIDFSNSVSKMKYLTHMDIEFREFQNDQQEEYLNLFQDVTNLQYVKLKITDLRKYINLYQNNNIQELTLKQYSQFINFASFLLKFKVQKLINKQKAIIRRLQKDDSYKAEEFTKIIVLEEGGSELFQLCDCTVIDYSKRIFYFQQQRHVFLHFLVFYKYFYNQIIYSPQQTLYDLFEQ